MKMLKSLGALLITGLLLSSCSENSEHNTTISGTISAEEGPIILSYIDAGKQGPVALDTLELVDGKFSFSWDVDSLNFYTISTAKNYYIPLLVEPGESIELNIIGDDTGRDYNVLGSIGSQRIIDINAVSKYAISRIDSLEAIVQTFKDSANFEQIKIGLDFKFQKILDEAQAGMKAFLTDDPGNLTNLFIFSQKVGRVELVPAQGNIKYYEDVAAALDEKYPNNQHTKNFKVSLERARQVEEMNVKMQAAKSQLTPGNIVPEISLPAADGSIKNLSDLRGKVVLVDFWAAWCKPCRAENPNLVRMYLEYKDKGFDVFSVSLDGLAQQPNPKQAWMDAIKQDALEWDNHVSELQGWTSSVVTQFGFQGIPFTVLIDRDGTILATELRNVALEEKLKSIF